MANKKMKIVGRKQQTISAEQQADYENARRQAKLDHPPVENPKPPLPRTGIAAQIRRARKAQGLTWYAVAQQAGIPNSNTVRDIEQGLDAKLSNVEAVARVLGVETGSRRSLAGCNCRDQKADCGRERRSWLRNFRPAIRCCWSSSRVRLAMRPEGIVVGLL